MIPNRICQDVLLLLTVEVELLGHREGVEGEFSKLQNGINNSMLTKYGGYLERWLSSTQE